MSLFEPVALPEAHSNSAEVASGPSGTTVTHNPLGGLCLFRDSWSLTRLPTSGTGSKQVSYLLETVVGIQGSFLSLASQYRALQSMWGQHHQDKVGIVQVFLLLQASQVPTSIVILTVNAFRKRRSTKKKSAWKWRMQQDLSIHLTLSCLLLNQVQAPCLLTSSLTETPLFLVHLTAAGLK